MSTANSGWVLRLNRHSARACLLSLVHDWSRAENVRVEPVYVCMSAQFEGSEESEERTCILVWVDEVGVLDILVDLE